ncbi:MAG: hypothetical protein RL318_1110 [Fibrobacterota bacterium]|jgi:hypothetical protein
MEPDGRTEDERIRAWVEKACLQEMPILSGTLGEIDQALAKEEYSAFALARVILQDPPLTAKVLRVSNSVFYNPSGRQISMVSRAIIVLGFDTVRSICTSIAIIEGLLNGTSRERLFDEIARALHAAVVAKYLAKQGSDPSPEEVFVSTLLRRVGCMVFWGLGDRQVDVLDEALKASTEMAEQTECRVLGFPLRKLSSALSDAWRLPTVSRGDGLSQSRKGMEDVAWSIALEARKGWDSPGLRKAAREVAWMLSCDEDHAVVILKNLGLEAAEYALALGSQDVASRIPTGLSGNGLPPDEDPSAMGEENKGAEIQVLQEITSSLLDRLDVNSILQMVLEGIHRGVGMDRTALAIIDPRTGEVRCKLALGKDRKVFMERFTFPVRRAKAHALIQLLEKCDSQLLDPSVDDPEGIFAHPVFELFQEQPFLAQAVGVKGRALGLFIADRHATKRAIDRSAWENFRMLGRHADIALTLAASRQGNS